MGIFTYQVVHTCLHISDVYIYSYVYHKTIYHNKTKSIENKFPNLSSLPNYLSGLSFSQQPYLQIICICTNICNHSHICTIFVTIFMRRLRSYKAHIQGLRSWEHLLRHEIGGLVTGGCVRKHQIVSTLSLKWVV